MGIPVKYECDSRNLTCTFARLKVLLMEKLTNGALVPPTPRSIGASHTCLVIVNRLLMLAVGPLASYIMACSMHKSQFLPQYLQNYHNCNSLIKKACNVCHRGAYVQILTRLAELQGYNINKILERRLPVLTESTGIPTRANFVPENKAKHSFSQHKHRIAFKKRSHLWLACNQNMVHNYLKQ